MFFLNLTATEFFVLLGALSTLVTVLYLLDRVKRKKTVSSLRFWTPVAGSHDQRSRRRLNNPWSLVLQLVGLLLLLLALGQLQWGTRALPARDHVLILDSSAWSGQQAGRGTLLDREKRAALAWAASIVPADRVMLVRADERPVPLTPFTSDHRAIQAALRKITPSDTALDVAAALRFAREARAAPFGYPGSIVYIGPGMIQENASSVPPLENLRIIPVSADLNHVGIRRVSILEGREPGVWDASVNIANYGAIAVRRTVLLSFGQTAFAPRSIALSPFEEKNVDFAFQTSFAGPLSIHLLPGDQLSADDRAQVWLPKRRELRVVIYTQRPALIGSLFPPDGRFAVIFKDPAAYSVPGRDDVLIFDQCAPPTSPAVPSLWIAPPATHSPAPVKAVLSQVSVTGWENNERSGIRLRSRDFHLASTETFETFPGDLSIAEVGSNPVAIARPATPQRSRVAVIGFDPLADELRFQVTTPLLLADLLSWVAPEAFHSVGVTASHVGLFTSELDAADSSQQIRVTDEHGRGVPFTISQHKLQVFTSHPQVLRISAGNTEQYVSLTLPEIARAKWTPDRSANLGLPSRFSTVSHSYDLWKLLAMLAGAVLLFEWLLYGPGSRRRNWLRPATNMTPARHETPGLALK